MSAGKIPLRRIVVMILGTGVCLGMAQTASAHSATINNEAWLACENHEKSDSCEYSDNHGDIYRGTCQLMSEKLLCVRNQPIERADPEATHRSKQPSDSALSPLEPNL